ncbi:RNA polymerase II C-terminal domain phosphatase-like 2 [Aegilops tauschii subsp. strangulata]|uniref:RNA polymerase II C-terminal domain phosphatase-like 2 n=1 Tax=Aegilops tauschii subsp. strangulata TaxID=200361 RepID=UPI003CC882B1
MAAAGAVTRRSMPLFDADVFLGDVDVLLPPAGTESASSSAMDLRQPAVFPRNEIRIRCRSPASERCPPLAVLQVISAYSLRCKLEAKAADLDPTSLLHRLHDSCWKKGMTAVVEAGEEDLHLVAMQSKQDPNTGYFVNIRPGWDDLKGYLITASGRQRFKVYVCTMAGRDYALEIWRLLDPEGSLISLREISQRLICVRPDSKKSLERVFRDSLCHPSMAMVLDDRRDVWDERDKRRVFVAPAYKPLVAPEDKVGNGIGALQILTNIACHARKGFFREFDGMLLKNINELMYENEVLDLPYSPDVGDYLQFKITKL